MADRLPRIGYQATADAGVGLVKMLVSDELGFLFRDLPTADMGIDGQIEVVGVDDDGSEVATGRLVAVQIKTGASYFRREDEKAWLIQVPKRTMQYWRTHSLPVVLILADPEAKVCYWVRADSDEHAETESDYRLEVPKASRLDGNARQPLARIAENTTEAGRRLARLQGDLELMRAIREGASISVDLGHWWNKSSGRTDVVVGYSVPGDHTGGPEGLEPITSFGIIGGGGTPDVVESLFPWAEVKLDHDFLESRESQWYDDYLAATGTYDREDGVYIDVLGTFDSSGFYDEENPAPYADAAGEVGYYRYSLQLNHLGTAFLAVTKFLEGF